MNILDSRNNFEWRDYLKIFMRRKIYFLLPLFLILAAGIFKIVIKEPEYESFTIIQIQSSRLPVQLSKLVPGVTVDTRYMDWKKHILRSEYLLKIIHELELDKEEWVIEQGLKMQEDLPDKSMAEITEFLLLKELREKISIRQFGDNQVEIRALANSAQKAHMIVNNLTETFREDFLEQEVSNIQSALAFSVSQIEKFQQELRISEEKYNSYRRSVLGSQASDELLTEEARQRISDAIVTAELTLREKREALQRLNGQMHNQATGNTYPSNFAIKTYIADINQKVAEEAQLQKRFVSGSAEIMRVNRSISQMRENLRTEFTRYYAQNNSATDPATRANMVEKALLLVDLQISEKRQSALQGVLESSRKVTSLTQSQETTLKKLEQEVAMNRDIYNLLLQQAQGTQIEEAMQRANAASRITVIEPPTKPLEPENAGNRMLALITLVVAFVVGGIAVYLREYFDGTLQTVEETEEYFGLPVLCVLPYLEQDHIKDRNKTDIRINVKETVAD